MTVTDDFQENTPQDSTVEKRTIAKYLGPTQHTRILEKKQTNKDLLTSLKHDLVWEASNRWQLDVTDEPKEVLDYLKEDTDFELSERDVAVDE